MHWSNTRPTGRQAVAADPEILLAIENECAMQELHLGVCNPAMAAVFRSMCCMRLEHMKSILLNLSTEHWVGNCCWDKNKSGYSWCMPSFIPAGRDVGETLWSHWR